MTATAPQHKCRESADPRQEGYCACGKRIVEHRRDRQFERELTRQIAQGLSMDVTALNVLAERRADRCQYEYGHDFPDLARNLEREAGEELLDARNYIVWRLDAIRRGLSPDGDSVMHLQRALRHVALAFNEVRAADTQPERLV